MVVFHVFAIAACLSWVHGGTRAEHLAGVPWMSLLALEWLLLLPPVLRGETLADARSRVWRALVRDPLLYVGVVLTLFLVVQWANGGGSVVFNAQTGLAVPQAPPFPRLPWCVERGEAVQLLYWFPPACAAALAVRHGMTRRGRRLLLHLLLWNGALLALFGFVENLSGATSLYWITPLPGYFFASFGYPNHAGAYFALLFAVGAGSWCQAVTGGEATARGRRWIVLVPALLCLAAVWASRSRTAIVLATILLLAGGVYMLGHMWRRIGLAGRVQAMAFAGAVLAAGALVYYVIYPHNPVRTKMDEIDFTSPHAVLNVVAERGFLVPLAIAVWRDHPWFGVGGWGFRSFVAQYMDKAERPRLFHGAANVHNDGAQFLAEHGVIGCSLLLALAALLIVPCVRGMRRACPVPLREDELDKPPRWCRILPGPLFLFAGAVCTVLHSLVDLPFRCPAVLLVWVLVLGCLPALLPAAGANTAPVAIAPDLPFETSKRRKDPE